MHSARMFKVMDSFTSKQESYIFTETEICKICKALDGMKKSFKNDLTRKYQIVNLIEMLRKRKPLYSFSASDMMYISGEMEDLTDALKVVETGYTNRERLEYIAQNAQSGKVIFTAFSQNKKIIN